MTVAGTRLAPALLSCGDTEPKAEVRYEAIAFTPGTLTKPIGFACAR